MAAATDRRIWIASGALGAIALAAVGWFLLIHPKLTDASASDDRTAATQLTNIGLASQLNTLKAKSAKVDEYARALTEALEALPYDTGVPAFTRQAAAQAHASGVKIASITVGGVTPTTALTAGASAASGSTATGGSTGTGVSTTTTTATGTTYAIQITVVSQGSLQHQTQFLHALQYLDARKSMVTSTVFAPSAGAAGESIDAGSVLTAQLCVFSSPRSPSEIAQLTKLMHGDIGS